MQYLKRHTAFGKMGAAFKEEIRRFCANSSIKGVPRVGASDTYALKAFWILATLGLLAMAGHQGYKLVLGYLEYPVVTSFYEKTFHPAAYMPRLPTMTICSENPFASRTNSLQDIPSPLEFQDIVNEKLQCGSNCTLDEEEAYSRAKISLNSVNGYFQNIGLEHARLMSHSKEEFVAQCQLLAFKGVERVKLPCEAYVDITEQFLKYYFNCFDVVVNSATTLDGSIILGIELVLHFDNHSQFKTTIESGAFTGGARVLVSETGAVNGAMIDIEAVRIPIGHDITLDVHPTLRERESDPYGNCFNYSESEFASQYHCFGHCMDTSVVDDCKCLEPDTPVLHPTNVTYYCMFLGSPVDHLVNNTLCRDKSLINNLPRCLDKCPLGCHEVQYRVGLQTLPWPNYETLTGFYKSFIKGKSYEDKYSSTRAFIEGNFTNDWEEEVMLTRSLRHIKNNFARVSMFFTDHRVYLLKDVKKIVLSELGSQLGGALNLWSGITIVVVLELAELLYRLMRRIAQFKTMDPSSVSGTGNEMNRVHCATCRCSGYPL